MLCPNPITAKESEWTRQTAHCSFKPDEPLLRIHLEFLDAIFQKSKLQSKGVTSKALQSNN